GLGGFSWPLLYPMARTPLVRPRAQHCGRSLPIQAGGCLRVVGSTIRCGTTEQANGDDMAAMNGTIKTLTGKGFGFIATADGQEYFFHQSACADMRFDELREGQAVTFEKGQGPKGPRAENVRRA